VIRYIEQKKRPQLFESAERIASPNYYNKTLTNLTALAGIGDDSQVVELVARKVYGDDPRLVVTVTIWECAA
jgi:Holliday junction resolvase RusA-like endonuclease